MLTVLFVQVVLCCDVVPAEWPGAIVEWAQHTVLGYWVHQWFHARGAGEQVPGDCH